MERALVLALRGPAHGPNPRVGAVLLAADGTTLAEGWHAGAGTPHAEAMAVDVARRAGVDLRGATAVVTLEPCSHTGRTGPCTEVLIGAGVRRVLAAVSDPGAESGHGADVLRTSGVEVELGLLAGQGEELLRVWLAAVRRGRPWVTLKLATTLDGRVAASDGSSRWITSAASRARAHAQRETVDAIVVGSGTVLADDPSLTARTPWGELADHQPLRVAVGLRDVPAGARLRGPGGELVHLATHDPREVLDALAAREVRHVLVEGGPVLSAAFLAAGLVDEVHAYVAPVLLGAGRPAVADLGIATIARALRLTTLSIEQLGPDVLLVSRPQEA
ncbi:MAG: bifunctional diaminohydroxyphosphoribosylaminopyrimidine deaminase/5-amino-6-(5-phosphoribosylamino)uracil reductase RibD [Cellulomonadaceae bacterium]|nr:bifunctional diaminohydroxyphosphoribosylaminopyrimidine deaminase/5-amino-6-(5-phosphoribosylamino)uracil reductase RibD [Cellulomonadaceae bacterium]